MTTRAALADSSARVTAGPVRTRRMAAGPLARLRREPATAAALVGAGRPGRPRGGRAGGGRRRPALPGPPGPLPAPVAPPSLRHRRVRARPVEPHRLRRAGLALHRGAVVLLASTVGVPLGLVGGYAGGWTDAVVMRVLDSLLAVPAILLAMGIIAVLGPSVLHAVLAVAVVSIPAFARIARASTRAAWLAHTRSPRPHEGRAAAGNPALPLSATLRAPRMERHTRRHRRTRFLTIALAAGVAVAFAGPAARSSCSRCRISW